MSCAERGERWWHDPEALQEEQAEHGTLAAAARAHGLTPQTLSAWWKKLGLPPLPDGRPLKEHPVTVDAPKPTAAEQSDDWLLDAIKKAGDDATVEELADIADTAPRNVREALDRLTARGYRIAVDDGHHVTLARKPPASDLTFKAAPALFDGDLVRFGVVSDTHLGSKECRLTELHTAYRMMADLGVSTVYHPGDLVAGSGIYRHQLRDLDVIGFDNQVRYAVHNYPREDGIETFIVGGNHDIEGDYGRDGADPVRAFCAERDDFHHLGDYSAWVELPNGGRLHILHPGGGGSYAISYRAQKIAEGYEGGTKPNATLFGHWHRRGDFTARSINLLLCGTFEGSTSLAKRYGLGEPAVGFHVVECRMADDGSLVEWAPRWYPFYRGRVVV